MMELFSKKAVSYLRSKPPLLTFDQVLNVTLLNHFSHIRVTFFFNKKRFLWLGKSQCDIFVSHVVSLLCHIYFNKKLSMYRQFAM